MQTLYPLRFKPIFKEKIWGGQRLGTVLNRRISKEKKIGESWEISSLKGNISVVSNGFLKGNNLQELIEIYMGNLVGEKVYLKYGIEFPLLVKFIDANDLLSLQVHPDDALAMKRHHAYGKTEMWYIIESAKDSKLVAGFNRKISVNEFLKSLDEGSVSDLLNYEVVNPSDVFYIPAGRIHSTGAGILLAEVQQSSDITYRVYDWGRNENGKPRELHTKLAIDVIDYNFYSNYRTDYKVIPNKPSKIIECSYFTSNILDLSSEINLNYEYLDSFVIYICVNGSCSLNYNGTSELLKQGDTILIPAELNEIDLMPTPSVRILEFYIS
jgi:mannose-6-phosphate isomerase